ncbi:MAG: hypothetical protein ABIE22_00730 [archaeon]
MRGLKIKRGLFTITFIILVIALIGGFVIFILLKIPSEDSWIKDERGIYVKHGYPISKSLKVVRQQAAIELAFSLYDKKKAEGMNFSSQCLGVVSDYAVDIVHVPRSDFDDFPENQCEDYRSGEVKKFIELDFEGEIVRIKD